MSGDLIESITAEYRRYKQLGEGAFAQLTDPELVQASSADDNSVAMIVWHVAGNLKSRFTDFRTSDGEKPWRNRDEEFTTRTVTRGEIEMKSSPPARSREHSYSRNGKTAGKCCSPPSRR